MKKLIKYCLFLKCLLFLSTITYGQGLSDTLKAKDLVQLSFEELMNITVNIGTLTGIELSKLPASLTIISNEDIKNTPARNIFDLIEVYVPGALIIESYTHGPIFRMRGLGDRNYKTVLLVNGRPVNQKGFLGSMVELRNWDMNDIERIEVIQGPGSVTYGPGAIAGVINIITKQAGTLDGFRFGGDYNSTYNSGGGFLMFGKETKNVDMLIYTSFRKTTGFQGPKYFYVSSSTGKLKYYGKGGTYLQDGSSDGKYPSQNYLQDYNSEPQIKAYLDLKLFKEWRLWARYSNSGQTIACARKDEFANGMQNRSRFQDRYFITAVENTHQFSKHFKLASILSFDSEEYSLFNGNFDDFENTNMLNAQYNFSESELFFRSTLNYKPSNEKIKAAVGIEYSYDFYGAPWGQPSSQLKMRAARKNFLSDTNSIYFGDGKDGTVDSSKVAGFVGNGWGTNSYSMFGELMYSPIQKIDILLSGRLDKNDFTEFLFSPRIAIVTTLSKKNVLKAIWQKSVRMNTGFELYYQHLNDLKSEPEALNSFELVYERMQNKNFFLFARAFYNHDNLISWSGTNAELIGKLEIFGIEAGVKYKNSWLDMGLSHSFVKQLEWIMNEELKESGTSIQSISYADYYNTKPKFFDLNSTGNEQNNWANNSTKLYANWKIISNLVLHIDSRVFWGFEGGKQSLEMYKKAYAEVDTEALTPDELIEFNENYESFENLIDDLDARNVYGIDFRLNASLTWRLPIKVGSIDLSVYSQNLLGSKGNIRYRYQDGNNYNYPARMKYIEEPRTFGFRLTVEF